MSVLPASPIQRIEVVRRNLLCYTLTGYTTSQAGQDWGGWPFEGAWLTRRGATGAARRYLRREHGRVVTTVTGSG